VDGDFKVCERIGDAPLIGNINDGIDIRSDPAAASTDES